jgi:hypothetical protein
VEARSPEAEGRLSETQRFTRTLHLSLPEGGPVAIQARIAEAGITPTLGSGAITSVAEQDGETVIAGHLDGSGELFTALDNAQLDQCVRRPVPAGELRCVPRDGGRLRCELRPRGDIEAACDYPGMPTYECKSGSCGPDGKCAEPTAGGVCQSAGGG